MGWLVVQGETGWDPGLSGAIEEGNSVASPCGLRDGLRQSGRCALRAARAARG